MNINISIFINKPCRQVFEFVSNFENSPKWRKGMEEVIFTSEPPLKVGSTYDQVGNFLGNKVVSSFKVIEYVSGKYIKTTNISSSFPITLKQTIIPKNLGAQLKASIEGNPKGFSRIFTFFFCLMIRKTIKKDYRNLKILMESNQQF